MKRLDLTLATPAENLALDEALVETADVDQSHVELLRLWEPRETFVVIGRSSPLEQEVNLPWCDSQKIKIFRRASGGASIVTGPGCLMYAVLLDLKKRPHLRMLDQAHRTVMETMSSALASIGIETQIEGTCDLTIDGRKVSGNSLRVKRNFLIYHGTMICDFDTATVSQCLGTPVRQPDYRNNRSHADFLAAIPATTEQLRSAIAKAWEAEETVSHWPEKLTQKLAVEKYRSEEWLRRVV